MCVLRRRSHLLYDELERERQGNKALKREVIRLRDKYGRVGYLVREIDELRMRNELLAREIQRRRQVNNLHQMNEENSEPLCRPGQRASRFKNHVMRRTK